MSFPLKRKVRLGASCSPHTTQWLILQSPILRSFNPSSFPVIHGLPWAPISQEKLTVILIAQTSQIHYCPLAQIFTLSDVKWHLTSLPITAALEESWRRCVAGESPPRWRDDVEGLSCPLSLTPATPHTDTHTFSKWRYMHCQPCDFTT